MNTLVNQAQENEHLSTENEHWQQEQSVQWRRDKVLELSSQGHSQRDISKILQVSLGTVNKDLTFLRQQSRQKIRKYIDETLPNEYEKCLVGITSILKEAWTTSQNTENKREKIHALSLAKECYSMKLDLLTNVTVVNDAIKFVSTNSNKKLKSKERENNSQQSQELNYNYEYSKLQDDQEQMTTEISKVLEVEQQKTTINQVF
jgi:hypothetical protein